MFKLTFIIASMQSFWNTILYIFQYLLLSISHLYIFVSSFKLKIKRIIFNLFLNRIISRQLLFPFIVLSWQPVQPSQAIQTLISKHSAFTYEARLLVVLLVLFNIIYIINFYVQHSQNRPKHLSKIDRKRWYKMVCWSIIFSLLLCLTIVVFYHYMPLFKVTWYLDDGNVDYMYTQIKNSINTRVFRYYCWMGCLVSLLVLIFFISYLTGVKLKPGKLQSDERDYLSGSGF